MSCQAVTTQIPNDPLLLVEVENLTEECLRKVQTGLKKKHYDSLVIDFSHTDFSAGFELLLNFVGLVEKMGTHVSVLMPEKSGEALNQIAALGISAIPVKRAA